MLLGGFPFRLIRLTDAGARTLDGLLAGPGRGTAAATLARRLLDAGVLIPGPLPHPHPPPQSELSAVVPVRDDVDGLERCLRSLRAVWPEVDVVVVDDASLEGSAVTEVSLRYSARVIRNDVPRGPGAARNAALSEVRTPFVVLIDADVELIGADPWPRWWSLLEDDSVAVVAPRVRGFGGHGGSGTYERERFPLDLGGLAGRIAPRARVTYAPAALLVARIAALAEVGGFEPSLRYGEDVDLLWRLCDVGWRCWYDGATAARHPVRPEQVSRARQRFRYGTSAAALAARHGDALSPWRGSRWTPAVLGLCLTGHPAVAVATVGVNAAALQRRLGARGIAPFTSLRLVGVGHATSGRALLRALVRPWWPLTLLAVPLLPARWRRRLLGSLMVPALAEWARRRPPLDPLRWTLWWLADDVVYGAGVWAGWWANRRRPRAGSSLRPVFTEWSGSERDVPT